MDKDKKMNSIQLEKIFFFLPKAGDVCWFCQFICSASIAGLLSGRWKESAGDTVYIGGNTRWYKLARPAAEVTSNRVQWELTIKNYDIKKQQKNMILFIQ